MASDTSLVFNLVARERVSSTLGKMQEKLSTAAAGISAGVAAALTTGVASAMDNEAITDKLAAQIGATGEQADEFGKIAGRLYAKGLGESMQDSADAMKALFQNDLIDGSAEDIENLASKVMGLGQVFDQEAGQVSVAVSQMLKTGLAKTSEEALDIITVGFQQGADKAGDLLDTMNEYGTQFRKFGLDGQMATGLLVQGLRSGARDADLVADAIKEFSIRAIDGSTATADGFKAIGLDATKMAATIAKGGPEAAAALDLTLDKLRAMKNPVDQAAAATALFGTQAEDLGASLFSLDPSSAVAGLGEVAGAADKAAKTISDNPAHALEVFKREAQAKLAEIGGQFVQWAMTNQQYVQPLAVTLGVVAGAILLVRGAQMAWAAAQAIWTGATTVATAAQWAWNVALSANPIGLIIIGVVALIAAIVLLWRNSETFRDIVTGCWDVVWSAIKFVWEWVKGNWPLLLGILTGPIGMAVWAIVHYWDDIKAGGVKLFNWIMDIPGALSRALGNVGEIILAPFKWGFNAVARAWNAGIGNIHFTTPDWVPGIGGKSFSMPRVPMLAKGGHIAGAGTVLVGEAGPELLSLPTGATVTPLSRAGAGGVTVVRIEVSGPEEMKRLLRRIVRTDGGGNVQTAFGST